VIGIFEATSIDRRVKKLHSPRPLTHDLIASVVDSLGAELQDIYINELRDHTYFAKLRIRQNGELVEIDSRPSDDASSLALLTTGLKQSKKFPVRRRRCLGTSNIAGHGVGGGRMAIVPLRFNERMIHQQGRAL